MADLLDASDWQQRYGVIEDAYCQGRWAAVMERGTAFLRELLEAGGDRELMALRHRMQLLMAHTLLHGYGDRDAAEDLYEVVRSSDAEPALRQIATDGLDQCHQPLPSTLTIEEDGEDDDWEPSEPVLFLPDADSVDGEDDASALDDPDKGASLAAQMPLRPLPRSQPKPNPEEATTALGVAADPFGARSNGPLPLQDQDAPVMPWVSEPSPGPRVSRELTAAGVDVVDVVEEPELIEVHQANPWLAEEVDLQIKQEVSHDPSSPEDGGPEVDGDLRTGLLLVVVS